MKPFTPTITKTPARTVLTITTVGDPNVVTAAAMQSMYGTAYGTKFKVFKPKKVEMKIGAVSAYWPDAHKKAKSKWTGNWMLEVPAFVRAKDLVQKNLAHPVKLKKIPAQLSAEVLYIGLYTGEESTIARLHQFMKDQKLTIVGPHEEVYLSRPGPKAKTLIRYAVKRKKS